VERRGRATAQESPSNSRSKKLDPKVEEDLIAENQRLRKSLMTLTLFCIQTKGGSTR